MKTTKWKKIVIKNPKLSKLRLNLRTIIHLAVYQERKRLRRLGSLYRERFPNLTHTQHRRKRVLTRLLNELSSTHYKSILNCSMGSGCKSCGKGEYPAQKSLSLDMAWNPLDKNWICTKCYEYYFGTEKLKNAYIRYINKINIS